MELLNFQIWKLKAIRDDSIGFKIIHKSRFAAILTNNNRSTVTVFVDSERAFGKVLDHRVANYTY
jgi:hypothetical protein